MPELINTFIRGKMNKDLDERLVPNGEYRDALNLEVATSDGSDVGSLQSVLGNSQKANRTLNPVTTLHESWLEYGIDKFIPSDAKCIGSIIDPTTEKIYWFITSNSADAIVEYDQVNDVVYPIIVDLNRVLQFKESFLITGVNIIEGFLFFTDNQTEPKKIEISKFKEGSVDFVTHTQIHNRNFILSDVTVIKKAPLSAPIIYKKATTRDGEINTTTVAEFARTETGTDIDPTEIIVEDFGTIETYNWSNAVNYIAGDFLLLTIQDPEDNFLREFQVRLKVIEVFNEYSASCELQTAGEDIPTGVQGWEVTLELDDPLFEFKFPRFATRYKYDDNQFSVFSPFSDIAFIPGDDFEYTGADGYNLAMTNNVRVLEIRGFVPSNIPDDVVAVDILYKDSVNPAVYRVDTIERNSNQWNDVSYSPTDGSSGLIKIETELISSLLPSNQLLRPYDNVPKKALAQEITANRLIYANYTQNFDMIDYAGNEVIPQFDFSIVHDSTKNAVYDEQGNNIQTDPIAGPAIESLKSMRTYQMGVVYLDEFGRQTPVFTNDSGSRSLSKEFANLYNTINIKLTSNPPKWAKYYKYYIKETSNEYYNVALDRYYLGTDGSAWLSFPSADRNKVDEETFLELKKQHDNDNFIADPARYKILAISNEAPDAIKIINELKGSASTSFTSTGFPLVDRGFFEMTEDAWENSFAEVEQLPDLKVRIAGGSNITNYYDVIGVTKQGDIYRIQLKEPTDDTISFTSSDGTYANRNSDTYTIQIYQEISKNKPEYDGRFFVKVYKDAILEQNILKGEESLEYTTEYVSEIAYLQGSGKSSYWDDGKGWFWDKVQPLDVRRRAGNDVKYEYGDGDGRPYLGLGADAGQRQLSISFHGFGNPWKQSRAFYNKTGIWWGWADNDPDRARNTGFARSLDTAGSVFRWVNDSNKESTTNIYTITKSFRSAYCVASRRTGRHGSGKYGNRRVVRWNITIDKPIVVNPTSISSVGTSNPATEPVEFLKLYNVDAKSYTSENPAIFETYPKEAVDMDLYYAASNIYPIQNPGTTEASHGTDIKVLSWFNCYSFGQGVESNRIRDDFNQPIIDKNPVVSTVLDEAYGEELKATGLIFSQIFNSRSGVNRLNQFIQAEAITKDLNPAYTSIQKLYSRDTNLITLCEDKCLQILANKDALFNADGNVNITSNKAVLGQALPYAGEYGISKNPESFAAYGNRAYFTDKNRGVVLRLAGGLGGGQGLTEISAANLRDFFADNLHASSKLIGSYDDDKDQYNLTFDALTTEWSDKLKFNNTDIYDPPQTGTTVSWKEDVKGWTARKDYIPESAVSLNNTYYTFKNGKIWEHGASDATRNTFYGREYDSAIRFIFNQQPASVKKFKTLNYSGSKSKEYRYKVQGKPEAQTFSLAELQSNTNYVPIAELNTEGWYTSLIKTNLQEGYIKQFKDKEGKFFNYIKGIGTEFNTNADNNLDSQEFSMQGIGRATIGGDPQSAFNLTFKLDPSCSTTIQQPLAFAGSYVTSEDCQGTNCTRINLGTLTSDPQGLPLTYTLVANNTSNGTLYFGDGTDIYFEPNSEFNGYAGTFTYRANNGTLDSVVAAVTVNVSSTNDGPVINSNPPVGPHYAGNVYTYSPITAVDPDHDPSEIAWSSNNLPSGWTLTTSGEGFTGTATVSGTLPIGPVSFDVTVTDPDGSSDTQNVTLNSLSQVLQELLFVGRYVENAVSQEVWTDPNTGYQTTVCGSPAGTSGGHTCGRGNFIIKANGVAIGSINISNSEAGVYYDQNGNPISAGQQPTYNEPYNTTLNSAPSVNDRYSSFQMDEATASQIAAAAPNGDITFTLECGSFEDPAGVTANCHSNALWFNIFRPGHPQYLCTAFDTFTSITINAFTGQIPQPY